MTDDVLEHVMRLHKQRKAQTGWASSFTTGRVEFHRRLLSRSGLGRGPAAVLAIHGGEPVGAIYGFWWQETFSYYQGGWEDRWSHLSLGTVLNAEAIAECSRRGGRIYDFLRGDEEYKQRFGAVSRTDQTWIRPAGLSGLMVMARSKAAKRIST
jgi:CelD/BcsL family acetyltransferase involved in cellulose biosynthesis